MTKAARPSRWFTTAVAAASVLFAGTGCVSTTTWRDVADSSVATVTSTILDLTVIQALECALTNECPQ